jgi:hypothetical protein
LTAEHGILFTMVIVRGMAISGNPASPCPLPQAVAA